MNRFLPLSLALLFPLAGCGGGTPAGGTGGGASSTTMAESLAAGLSEMIFRPMETGEGILGPRFVHPVARYSIRPPIGWSRTDPGIGSASAASHRVVFRDPRTGDFLDLGIMKGGPAILTPSTMIALKDSMAAGLRSSAQGEVIATDAFRFGPLCAVQTMVNRRGTILLHLLVFRKPGSFLQVVYGINQSRYRRLARSVEASLASLAWS
jgi:hypothetical protein